MLLFMDGFDFKGSESDTAGTFWDEPAGSGYNTGRFGGFCARVGNQEGMRKWFSTAFGPTLGVGFAWIASAVAQDSIVCSLWDGTSAQVDLRWSNAVRQLYFTRNGTTISSNSPTLLTGVWYHLELKVFIHASTGTVELRVNGITVISGTGLNTKNTANNTITRVGFVTGSGGSSGFVHQFDDIFVWDSTGSANNTFLGDCRVATMFPTGAGTTTQWTPSTGSNWQNVDDVPPNDDTDYNSTSTTGNIDTYALGDLSESSATIMAVQSVLRHRKDDAGTRTLRRVFRSGGTNYEGADIGVLDSYTYAREILEQDPATSAAWTLSAVNALEAGMKLQA